MFFMGLQGYFDNMSSIFQVCFIGVTRVFLVVYQGCFKGVPWVLHFFFKCDSRVLQLCFEDVSRKIQL